MGGQNNGSVLFAASVAQIMIVLDATIIVIALPEAQLDLGFRDADTQWAISVYAITFGALLMVGGRIVERIGPRLSFGIAAGGFALASVLGGLASGLGMLLVARVLQGVFAALLGPANLSMVASTFVSQQQRARAFAVFGATAGAGAALGLLLGGVLTEYLGWRWCLFVNVVLAVICLANITRIPGRPKLSAASRSTDVLGLSLGSTSLFLLIFGVSEVAVRGWLDPIVFGSLILSILSLILFVTRLFLARNPIFPPFLLKQRLRRIAYVAVALVGFAQMASSLYLSYFLQNTLEFSALQAGLALVPLVLALVIAAIFGMRTLVLRFGPLMTIALGLAVQAGAFALLSQMIPTWNYAPWILLGTALLGFGIGLVMAPAVSTATEGVPVENSGVASSLTNTAQQVGGAIGVAAATSFAVTRFETLLPAPDPTIPQSDWPMWAQSQAYGDGFAAMAATYAVIAVAVMTSEAIRWLRARNGSSAGAERLSSPRASDGVRS